MSRKYKITVNDLDISDICQGVSISDYVNSIGRFDTRLTKVQDFVGFETVKIYDDDLQVFQGRIESPVKENTPSGEGMPLGGSEWTARLRDYLTNRSSQTSVNLTTALTEILINSPYGLDDIDEVQQSEVEVQVWDTTLEFVEFTFSDTCIVYTTTEEITDELTVGTFEFPDSSRRCCFYDKSDDYFYVVAYDDDNNLLKYNSTADFVTWKGWTSLGFNKGDNGTFGLAWDESLGILYLIVHDGTNLDSYEYTTDGTGTLTQTDFDDDVAANSDLICGPIIDDEGDVWFIAEDTTATNYELWQFDISANTWTLENAWAVADNDDPKYMFRGEDTGDVIVIIFDDDANDIEEWLWDESGSTFAFVRKIGDVTTVGFACGFQDVNGNMFIVWEDTDLDYSSKTIAGTSWATIVEVVDTADYQTMNQFQLSGDNAQNLYLFYVNDDGATQTLDIIRRFEETWGSTVELDTAIDTSSKPRSVADGQGLLLCWLDTGDDVHASLMSPYGIGLNRAYGNADEDHDYESGKDFDNENVHRDATLQATLNWSNSGVQSIEAITPGVEGAQRNCFGIYDGLNYSEIWYRGVHRVNHSGIVDDNDNFFMILMGQAGAQELYFGWEKNVGTGNVEWLLLLREGGALVEHFSGTTPAEDTDYCIEIHWVKDGAAGICDVYLDGVSIITVAGVDTDNGGNISRVRVGLSSNNCDNETHVYFDDVAFGTERIGCTLDGWFRTDTYTATGDMNEWGSLDSTNDDDANTSWGVWDNVPVLIVDGLITAVDLEDAGVVNTETDLQIRADMVEGIGSSRNYVFDVRLSEKQGLVDVDTDHERSSTATKKLADIIGYEYKLEWDDNLDFVTALGEDKSDYIILKTAKSESVYPSVKPNIIIVNREPDFDSFANAVYVLGAGDYPDRVEGEAQDAASQATFGIHWLPLTNKDCTSVGMANTYARTEVNARKDPIERINVEFVDDYDAGDIKIGDTVTIVDEPTDLNQTARIVALFRTWSIGSGLTVRASLINKMKSKTFIEKLAEISDLARWI